MKMLMSLAVVAMCGTTAACEAAAKRTCDCNGAVRMPAAAGESRPDVAPLSSPEKEYSTPHEYLYDDQPEAALAMLKQDRSWIHRRNEEGATVLHLAVGYGHIEVVKWLLDNGADVNAVSDINEATPLLWAESCEIVKLLIAAGADVNVRLGVTGTALYLNATMIPAVADDPELKAMAERYRCISETLVAAGAEYDYLSACYLGDVERIRTLLPTIEPDNRRRVMSLAAAYGYTDIVRLMHANGIDPKDFAYTHSALPHPGTFEYFLQSGIDVQATIEGWIYQHTHERYTLLHAAARQGAPDAAKRLIQKGAIVDAATSFGWTPLHIAAREGHPEVVAVLLAHGADPNSRTDDGMVPLELAAYNMRAEHPDDPPKNPPFLRCLRDLRRKGGRTGVFSSVALNDLNGLRRALASTPDAIRAQDPDGRTILEYAIELNRLQCVALLLLSGADILEFENAAETAEHYWCDPALISLLQSWEALKR